LLLHPTPPPPARVSKVADKLASILVAFLGGAFLLAPMYNLTYVHAQKYQLISVVLWVLFFAISLALSSRATNQELLIATAAYAAVLVVFVGRTPGSG
jgi:VIT1/CCC1 family predicted Fe2+/Mn2+ transporter